MYVVNKYNQVREVDDQDAEYYIKRGELRKADAAEVADYQATRAVMNSAAKASDTVYFQTVKESPDGYGMSRSHLKDELAKLKIVLSENFQDQKIGILYNYPYGVISMRSDVRIIYTMFESDKIPEEWADYLLMADEVLVPSTWCQKVFAKAGVKSTVVPLGYNDKMFQYVERSIASEVKRPFTFIHYDSFNLRKGWAEVFKAFTEEFTPDEPVRLVLKTAQNAVTVPIMKSQYPNIDTITGTLPERELVELMARADCMVYPSRGEGFGITPLEAMATGMPAIVPNEHGISEYFDPNYMLEVKAPERCPGLYSRFKGQDVGQMVVADVEDLKKQMRYAYDHQAEVKELGRAASNYVKKYTYAATAAQLAAVIRRWEAKDVIKRNDSKYLQVDRV